MNAERWKQIDELFDAVLDLPGHRRESFLNERTGGDPELKKEVLSLLKAQSGADNFLENSAMGMAAKNLVNELTIPMERSFAGRKIGSYQILSPLGAGGMGEVFLAYDDKLKRKVAVKILPAEFVADDERIKRFEMEARAIAVLNHPNIVTVYDVGATDGVNYIATEYVEGHTLREIIGRGQKLKETLEIIIQCCEALSAAHTAGIIHRDIKPENIMIRPDGYVKILDFGLVKLTGLSKQDFQNPARTARGIIIGTPAYMSPEQVADERVDHRTDLWSIGVVLFELLTGSNPFKKSNRRDIFHAILSENPPPASSQNDQISPELDRILNKALEKDADLSYQTASDLRADLKRVKREFDSSPSIGSGYRSAQTVKSASLKSSKILLIFGIFFPLLLVAVIGIYYFIFHRASNAPDWTRAKNIQLSDGSGTEYYPSLSPDGKTFIFSKESSQGNFDIFSQRVGGKNPVNLTQTSANSDTEQSFSPDGEFIAFRSERQPAGIYLMGASGENPRRVTDFGYHPAWSPDGKQLAVSTDHQDSPSVRDPSAIWIINIENGIKRLMLDNYALQPSWSPNGKRIAYWFTESGGRRNVATISTDGGEPVTVTNAGNTNWNPVWSPDGSYLYFASDRGGSMAFWRVRIDEVTGQPLDDPQVVPTPAKYNRHLAFSHDGKKLIYVQTENRSNLRAVSFNPAAGKTTGEITALTGGNRELTHPELSPDGRTFLVRQVSQTQEDLILLNRDGSLQRELTNDKYFDRYPRWSPDGRKIVFASDRSGKYEIWSIDADGTNLKQITFVKDNAASIPTWSPDGTHISFDNSKETFILDLSKEWSDGNLIKLPAPPDNSYLRVWDWSPDGKKLIGLCDKGQFYGMMMYSFETGKFENLGDFSAFDTWLSDSRRIIYTRNGKILITDTQAKTTTELALPTNEFVRLARLSRDSTMLYYSVTDSESDIWLLDLT